MVLYTLLRFCFIIIAMSAQNLKGYSYGGRGKGNQFTTIVMVGARGTG